MSLGHGSAGAAHAGFAAQGVGWEVMLWCPCSTAAQQDGQDEFCLLHLSFLAEPPGCTSVAGIIPVSQWDVWKSKGAGPGAIRGDGKGV